LGSLDGDLMFSLHVVGELLNWGLREMNEWINHWLWKWSISLHRVLLGEHEGGLIYRQTWEKGNILFLSVGRVYWGVWEACNRRLWKWASLSIGAPLGNLQGFRLPGLWETV
jgi:hypothetical protein